MVSACGGLTQCSGRPGSALPGSGRTRQADQASWTLENMDRARELSEFLKTRRARLQPGDAGAADFGGRRRVPGLRREELALLAGVSVDYYTRLEQGRARNVSPDVLDAVARALQLDADERIYLHNLAKPAASRKRPSRPQRVGPELRQALEALAAVPAYIIGRRLDILAWNDLARQLIADFPALPAAERNMARLVFLDEASRDLYPDWQTKARDTVANLRYDAGRHPDDPQLASLVGELSLGQQRLPAPVGRPQRPRQNPRPQAVPPPANRGARPRLRRHARTRRPGHDHDDLQRPHRIRHRHRPTTPGSPDPRGPISGKFVGTSTGRDPTAGAPKPEPTWEDGAAWGNRTPDLFITSEALYRLS